MYKSLSILSVCISLLVMPFYSCQNGANKKVSDLDPEQTQLFELMKAQETGLHFTNRLNETSDVNYIYYDGLYQGAGVGVGDFNNDGLEDIYFAGNMVPDKLFLNKGDLNFEDITKKAGVGTHEGWSTGVAVADVNGDGWQDIYVCKFLYDDPEKLKNQLYINNGDLTFTEKGGEYGIDGSDYSIMANFFDYDLDGDLDLYVGNQPPNARQSKKALEGSIHYEYTDRLYRNNGDGSFTDVTGPSGITNYTFTLSATCGDMNNDGWPDIYVACDYDEPDVFYQNNGDGTFTNVIDEQIRHISNFSMGADIADINNDGWLDIYTADMVADDNERLKTNMSGMNPEKFWKLANAGFHYQYMFNALQLNNGNGTYSEIAQLADNAYTDWSWAPLFVDFDNDGLQDLFVSNGLMRDMRDNDFNNRRRAFMQRKLKEAEEKGLKELNISPLEILQMAPSVKLQNFVFRNQGDLRFKRMMEAWGMEAKSWSNGTSYADFDNDGDVDLVLNNINDHAWVFKNTSEDNRLGNWLRVKLEGTGMNSAAVGTRVEIEYDDQLQIRELYPNRGYMSTCESVIHFGVGDRQTVDKLIVNWPDGKQTIREQVSVNQVLEIPYEEAQPAKYKREKPTPLFTDVSTESQLGFEHQENNFDDYAREILLPHRMSHLGPSLATADVNGDGLEDVYIGGPSGQAGALFLQEPGGKFSESASAPWRNDEGSEDIGALFFDADGDSDVDLYVVSGGNDFSPESPYLQDRLYLNNGNGQFKKANNALPTMHTSGSKARAADIDGDGDLDLFVGGRQIPGKYGFPAKSYILRNDNGVFQDITESVAPELVEAGMVTDASWNDLDGDQDPDLVIVGEWMPITVFINEGESFRNATVDYGLEHTQGWWNTIKAEDMDNDGDIDFVAGNLGLNIKYKASDEEPFKLYVKDFDGNGTNDVYLGYYDHDGVCYPVRGRTCSSQQMPYIKKKFETYKEFGNASIEEVLGSRMEGAVYQEAKMFTSAYIENQGESFVVKPLPNQAQISPMFGIEIADVNGDGHMDLITAGNYYEREVETTRSDAGIGQILVGNGKGQFEALHPTETGLRAYKDVRDIALIKDSNDKPLLLVANNNDRIQVYKMKGSLAI